MENNKNNQDLSQNESNDERDQDEGEMNNGTIGGSIGIISSNDKNKPKVAEETEKNNEHKD